MYVKKDTERAFFFIVVILVLGVSALFGIKGVAPFVGEKAGIEFLKNYEGGYDISTVLNIKKEDKENTEDKKDTKDDKGAEDEGVAFVVLKVKERSDKAVGFGGNTYFTYKYYVNSSITDKAWNDLTAKADFRDGANIKSVTKILKGFNETNEEYFKTQTKNKKNYKYKKELSVYGY